MSSQLTQDVLREMFTEDYTPVMCDSSFYGWASKSNAKRDFSNEPDTTLELSYGELSFTINTYHWLNYILEYDKPLDDAWMEFTRLPENERENYLSLRDDWLESIEAKSPDGDGKPYSDNTYNYNSALDQTLELTMFGVVDPEDEDHYLEYVLLSVHIGADVRGGYSTPHVFRVHNEDNEIGAYFPHDHNRGSIYNHDCGASWNTYDAGYRWHDESYPRRNKNLNEYTIPDEDSPLAYYCQIMWKLDGKLDLEKIERVYGDKDFLVATEQGEIICPVCGSHTLSAWF